MFFSRKKKTPLRKTDYGILQTDVHSHLLPGIDDGSPDLETSMALIKGMKDLGFKKLITTPHILWDMYKNSASIIHEKLEMVRKQLKEEEVDIQLDAAAEYFIDDHLAELLERRDPLLTFGNKMVLVEFSMVSQPFELKKILFELQMQGYQPVLAHPERYVYFEHNKNIFEELKSSGYLFQLNALSLNGYYGSSVMKLARFLASNKYYDLVGTDLHHFGHLNALQNPSQSSLLQETIESGKILNNEL